MKSFDVKEIRLELEDATAITAMVYHPGTEKIYAGMTSICQVLAEIDPKTDEWRSLGEIFPRRADNDKMHDKIHNTLCLARDGMLYFGADVNMSWDGIGGEHGKFDLHRWGGGAIYRYDPQEEKLEDLGIPVPMNGVHGLGYDANAHALYGYTIPDNHFFRFEIDSGKAEDYGHISNFASHNVGVARNGNVYAAWRRGKTCLLKYDPRANRLTRTDVVIENPVGPSVVGNVGMDSWMQHSDGLVYCGTASEGILFSLDPETDEIRYIGKPAMGPRLTAMVEDESGVIWGNAGWPVMGLFSYDPKSEKLEYYGEPETRFPMCYFHGMVRLPDGTIYCGETDRGEPYVYRLTPRG